LLERLLVLVALGLALGMVAFLVRKGAGRRLRRAQQTPAPELWDTLGQGPDGRPTVVAFSTPSCAACHTAQKPALAALEALRPGAFRILEVDAAARPEVAHRFGVMTVPSTAVLGGDGRLRALNQGFANAEQLAGQLAP
jgi:thioredoxin-like negative regulator of GroEL